MHVINIRCDRSVYDIKVLKIQFKAFTYKNSVVKLLCMYFLHYVFPDSSNKSFQLQTAEICVIIKKIDECKLSLTAP